MSAHYDEDFTQRKQERAFDCCKKPGKKGESPGKIISTELFSQTDAGDESTAKNDDRKYLITSLVSQFQHL